MTGRTFQLELSLLTHAGRKRSRNEDCVAVDTRQWQENMDQPHCLVLPLGRPHCLLVADGLGGHPAGDTASRLAAEFLGQWIGSRDRVEKETLERELRALNRYLFDRASERNQRGMGCTIAGIIIDPQNMLIFNVGDAVVFRKNSGYLSQLSASDSPAVSFGEPDRSLDRSIVTQCLGGTLHFQEIEPHIREERLVIDRCYLIATDGLTAALDLETIEGLLKEPQHDPAHRVLHAALASGAPDNLSLILMRIAAAPSIKENLNRLP